MCLVVAAGRGSERVVRRLVADRGRASTTACDDGGAAVLEQLATEGYGDPARPSFSALVSPSRTACTGDAEREQQQPAYAEPVPGVPLLLGAEDLQPDRRALVDERRVALHLVAGAHLA